MLFLTLFKKLRLRFSSKLVYEEFNKVKKIQSNSFFKLVISVMLFISISFVVFSLIYHSTYFLYPSVGWITVSILLLILSKKLDKCMDFIIFAIYLGYCVVGLILMNNPFFPNTCFPFFNQGYSFAMFEKIVTIRLPRFYFKVIFTLVTYALRCYLFPVAHDIGPLLYQTAVIVFSLMTDFWKEREDRRLFEEFYAYREGLTKFKTLIVSDLPTHILILSRDLKQILFKNDQLFKYIQLSHSDSLTEIELLTEWLQHLSIDRDNLSEEAELAMATLRVKLGKSPSVLRFLQIFKTYESQQDQLKYQFNAEYLEKQGSTTTRKTMETKVFSMTWDGKEAIALILNDVTEHNQNLTLKVADANKNKMLAMISHELRTPLNGILGVVSILKKELTEVRWLQYLAICKNSGELLLNLVNSILDLQHIRDNKFALKPTRDNLIELLTGIYDLFKFQFEQKNLYLELDICPDIPEYIVTDQNRLRQVLINLIGNALKFTFTGGVTISARKDPNKDSYVNFKVADTGPGIKEEDKKKLFNPLSTRDSIDINLETPKILKRMFFFVLS